MDPDTTEKKKDLPQKGAIVQRDRETYAIVPHLPGGLLDKETLLRYAAIFDRYHVQAMKITSGQRIAIIGFKAEEIDRIWAELGMKPGAAIGMCVRTIEMCPGTTLCKFGQQDSMGLGLKLDAKYHGQELPGKFKFAVAGCPMNCAAAPVRDIGIQGQPRGWKIFVGGCLGPKPQFGQELCLVETEAEVLAVVDKIIEYFRSNAKSRDRLGRLISTVGWQTFCQAIRGTV